MIWINGKRQSLIPIADRGLQYGDGVWETLAICGGKIEFLTEHLQRLKQGCLRLKLPDVDLTALQTQVERITQLPDVFEKKWQGRQRAVLKIIVTRGQGGRGYNPVGATEPNCIISVHEWPDYKEKFYNQGVQTTLCKTRLSQASHLAGFKHLNRLDQVLARNEWEDDYQEGLMCDQDGYVVEGVMSNLFILKNGHLLTPPIESCGVAGIMRATVMRIAAEDNMPCREQRLSLNDIETASALFLTNSIIGIWPVQQFRQQHYVIPESVRRLCSGLDRLLARD